MYMMTVSCQYIEMENNERAVKEVCNERIKMSGQCWSQIHHSPFEFDMAVVMRQIYSWMSNGWRNVEGKRLGVCLSWIRDEQNQGEWEEVRCWGSKSKERLRGRSAEPSGCVGMEENAKTNVKEKLGWEVSVFVSALGHGIRKDESLLGLRLYQVCDVPIRNSNGDWWIHNKHHPLILIPLLH